MLTALIFVLVLSVLVLVHELGHFLAARICGIKAHEFGIGLPPRIVGFVKIGKKWKTVAAKDQSIYKNTIWSINWLSFGGFVRLKGEDSSEAADRDSLLAHPMWQRMFVISAGVIMNWVLAVVLFSAMLMAGLPTDLSDVPSSAHVRDQHVVVTEVLPGDPADAAGMKANDDILSVDGQTATSADAMSMLIRHHMAGMPIAFQVLRDGATLNLTVTPVVLSQIHAPGVGIGLADVGIVSFSPLEAIAQGVEMTGRMIVLIGQALWQVVTDLVVSHQAPQDIAGPVGIAVLTGQAARTGITTLMQFAGMLSLNLAVLNILPIPALDGGRLFFMILEAIRRKPVDRNLEVRIHNIAYVLLLLLIAVVTIHDIGTYGGGIWTWFMGLFGR